MDASKEVRSLLEFLFLDVKVRSPSEVSLKSFVEVLTCLNILNVDLRLD